MICDYVLSLYRIPYRKNLIVGFKSVAIPSLGILAVIFADVSSVYAFSLTFSFLSVVSAASSIRGGTGL